MKNDTFRRKMYKYISISLFPIVILFMIAGFYMFNQKSYKINCSELGVINGVTSEEKSTVGLALTFPFNNTSKIEDILFSLNSEEQKLINESLIYTNKDILLLDNNTNEFHTLNPDIFTVFVSLKTDTKNNLFEKIKAKPQIIELSILDTDGKTHYIKGLNKSIVTDNVSSMQYIN